MDSVTILHYPDSSLSNVEQDYELGWEDEENPSYKHDGSQAVGVGERLDSERLRTVITDSMSVTASDEEKLQLLTKNTELRGLNAELMKLNQQWDEMYRSTTQRMHHTAQALQSELQSLRKHSEKLNLKLEQEQNKREFYESSLLQEMKKNQKLQEYIRHLEGIIHCRCTHNQATDINNQLDFAPSSSSVAMTHQLKCTGCSAHSEDTMDPVSKNQKGITDLQPPEKTSCGQKHTNEQDICELKEQLKALKCQTDIYAADYKSEHTDRQRIKTENEKLRKKEKEMREHMLLLKEQLKVYEDDFRKERCDKQVLQRLLKSRNSTQEPILVHRCNHERTLGNFSTLPRSRSGKEKTEKDL